MAIPVKYIKKLPDTFVNEYRDKIPPWGPVGYITYKRTYARQIDTNKREEWYQTVERCINGLLAIGCRLTREEAEKFYHYLFHFKCSFAGRGLWQLGTSTVERLGGDSLMNCWMVAIDEPIDPFCFTFNELMLGGGVGFNIQPEYVYSLPPVKYDIKVKRVDTYDCDFIVPDNREGWVELLERVLRGFFYTGKDLNYNVKCIRPKGQLIKSFGGIASGPEDLVNGIDKICSIIRRRHLKKLKPIDCLDILNIIGSIVVAGNLRRSAQLALGSYKDEEYLLAKDWSTRIVPEHRQFSNNSVGVECTTQLPEYFWKAYLGLGEPYGLINLANCRESGRLIDRRNYRPDRGVIGTNPCGEITLNSHECCDLFELFLPNIKTKREFVEIARLAYKATKSMLCLPFIHDKTNKIIQQNMRIGISVSGFLQSKYVNDARTFNEIYREIEKIDKTYSKELKVNESIKLTTVKPSGTVSLLPGVFPGMHPGFAEYYIRRISLAANDPLIAVLLDNGYNIEPKINIDGSKSFNTMVADIPIKSPKGILAKDVSAIDQLNYQKFLQEFWSDNSVSMTCYYQKEEINDLRLWLDENFSTSVKSSSFLLHSGHGFLQAPYEEISKEQYNAMRKTIKPITSLSIKDNENYALVEGAECTAGHCPIK